MRICLALLAVALLPHAPAFGFKCIEARSGGPCLRWTSGAAFLKSFLGSPGRTLINGTTSWDQNAVNAANEWNSVGALRFDVAGGGEFNNPCGPAGPNHRCANTGPVGDNPIFFASNFCGRGFGDIIALTNNCWDPGSGEIFNAPIFVNNGVLWNAYDGALRTSGGGQPIYDMRRLLAHEFGHVLGLDHPDEFGQNVVALMNSQISDLDRLQRDDMNGARSIYDAPPPSGDSSSAGCAIGRSRKHAPCGAVLAGFVVAWAVARRRRKA